MNENPENYTFEDYRDDFLAATLKQLHLTKEQEHDIDFDAKNNGVVVAFLSNDHDNSITLPLGDEFENDVPAKDVAVGFAAQIKQQLLK
ncbi:hypothetical protein IV38_GL000389 [Lactobacillus selangorensis]|uniref:Uncharacterized protein n=1 Tax=Lactobacillus selangorensis TaxID=81857 RepID=A0A0R2G117_9LACO|nr:hypothetical protein [Lactobacillus selangorensis]KRN29504.1 hypothetical protein IV38_GL000389 [Lactobacillus selangorensis]KRN33966.1 hypothetical protein IV40_GL000279 [Lactobacillus selangorensis]